MNLPANVKGALVISLGYVLMIAAAVIVTVCIRKAGQENPDRKADKYDLIGRITENIFKK